VRTGTSNVPCPERIKAGRVGHFIVFVSDPVSTTSSAQLLLSAAMLSSWTVSESVHPALQWLESSTTT
jgi:hypothetical protein